MRKSTQFKYNQSLVKKIICVSNATKEVTILGVERPERVEVVYDSIDLSFLKKHTLYNLKNKLKIASEDRVIINIANHYDAKDINMLPKAANELINVLGVKNVHFLQIGRQTKFTEEFLGLIEKFGLKSNFTYLNFLEDASYYLSEFEIYLMTSKSEGIPLTLHEAFAKEIPVVTTTAGGISELIKHEINGLSTDIGNYKVLAALCKKILDNKELSQKLTLNGIQTLKNHFNPEIMARKTLNVYKEVIER
jgi:glycosyltransferase involved in cell wall biosynthesis